MVDFRILITLGITGYRRSATIGRIRTNAIEILILAAAVSSKLVADFPRSAPQRTDNDSDCQNHRDDFSAHGVYHLVPANTRWILYVEIRAVSLRPSALSYTLARTIPVEFPVSLR